MKLKHFLGLVMALTAVGILTACGSNPTPTPKPADPVTITLIGAFPDFLDVMKGVQNFVEETNRISNGNVTIDWVGGPEVVSSLEQFLPVRDGLFDVTATVGAYHTDFTTLGLADNVVANRLDGGDSYTPRVECGFFAALDDAYQELGMKYLGAITGGHGARLWTVDKRETPDLGGMKLRAATMYKPFMDSLGASTVPLPFGEIYTALQKKVIDGLYWGGFGAMQGKWNEVVNYQYPDSFAGGGGLTILINLGVWDGLAPSQQAALEEAMASASVFYGALAAELEAQEVIDLVNAGVEEVSWGEAAGAKWRQDYFDLIVDEFILRDSTYGPPIAEAMRCVNDKIG
jgi:TRAP-type C4-dicarboxylate transport system substrate-binding protein